MEMYRARSGVVGGLEFPWPFWAWCPPSISIHSAQKLPRPHPSGCFVEVLLRRSDFFFLLNVLFLRQSVSSRGAEREGDTVSQAGSRL